MAAAGERGVEHVLEILRSGIDEACSGSAGPPSTT